MRFAALVLVLTIGAAAASAQSQFKYLAGPYVTLDALDAARLGDGAVEIGAGAGWRTGSGFDVGVRLGAEHARFDSPDCPASQASTVAFGIETGYTARLSVRNGLRLALSGTLAQTVEREIARSVRGTDGEIAVPEGGDVDANVGGVLLSAIAFQRVPLGRVGLQPTIGVFVGAEHESRADADRPFTLRADSGISGRPTGARAGLSVGLPVSFEVRDATLVVDLRGAYDVARQAPDVSVRLRANL